MRKIHFQAVILFLAVLSASCKPEVGIYADYREIPVIYGLLDASADTNYIKITRSFYAASDATQTALNPDSSNYPGRLDVRLTEYRNGEQTREIILDTITIRNKQTGNFYAPAQKLYYTSEPLNSNTVGEKYSYMLSVALPDSTLHVKADIVGGCDFRVKSGAVNFSKESLYINRPFYFYPAINAVYYEMEMSFTFLERRTPSSDSVLRTMHWKVAHHEDYYLASHMNEDAYVFTYRPETFWVVLRKFLGDDTLTDGVLRFIGDYPIELCISACGKNQRRYIYFNDPVNGIAPGDPEFTIIKGAFGVFSSRMAIRTKLRLAGKTVPDLMDNRYYGFRFMGGETSE